MMSQELFKGQEKQSESHAHLNRLVKAFNLDKSCDFIQFRKSFCFHFDFEKLRELAKNNQIKNTGSRSTSWKLMLGLLPIESDKGRWVERLTEERQKYSDLKAKYFCLQNQLDLANPLASLKQNSEKDDFTRKDDIEVRNLISKDVERTHQEMRFFKDAKIRDEMSQMLYIWAKEHPNYKYQQGLNEILAIVMVCLASELQFPSKEEQESPREEDEEDEDDQYKLTHDPRKLFNFLHSPDHFIPDTYALFERIMDLGIKELYFQDEDGAEMEASIYQTLRQSEKQMKMTREEKRVDKERQKMIRQLKQQRDESTRSSLKKRSNKIINNYLNEIDSELVEHLKSTQIEPELILLKQLRCLLTRQFTVNSVLHMWDYLFSGIEEVGRYMLGKEKHSAIYQEEDYYMNHLDALMNIDYVCLALIEQQRDQLIEADYIDCLRSMINAEELGQAGPIVKLAERIRKLLYERQIKDKEVIGKEEYPQMIERQEYKFTCLQESSPSQEDYDSCSGSNSKDRHSGLFFRVKEEDKEEDEEEEDLEGNQSQREFDENDYASAKGDDGELEGENYDHCSDMMDEGDKEDGADKKQFKLKNAKGDLIFDQKTKQKRYLSPFEQFLVEQQELYKKNVVQDEQLQDEQNSVTLTTTASTQFDQKNSGATISASTSEVGADEVQQKKSNLASANLKKVAKIYEIDSKIKTAEDLLMEERLYQKRELKSIRNYLSNMKTGAKIKQDQYTRSKGTRVVSK